ncbi:MAG: hypothetical protein J5U17_09665, partial [Candidatus Methanoperedens sp.]|nr:hypothetical protein [Candidatus Methanoperedens sp.]MCE8428097.1 hypothetical protein [Candidatus Methanoperedens sp.]
MIAKRLCIYLLILLITINPVYAADISLNRWVVNITIHDDGQVDEVIQAEIENGGSSPVDGISFIIPASSITMIYDFSHTFSSKGQTVEQKTVPGGIKIILGFNDSIMAGQKWDGRIGFTADNWAVKEGPNYSIDIPIEAPMAVVSGKETKLVAGTDPDVRSQVFLPRSVELISVEPEPFRELFQYDRIVPTWTSEKLHIGDTIHIKAAFSNVLDKIIEVDEKARNLADRIKKAKAEG